MTNDDEILTDDAGVELENDEDHIIKPFDPSKIRVKTRSMPIKMLMDRIKENPPAILLTPDFQRKDGLWTDSAQSKLIESILIRIPLPAFYMDATNEKEWLVIDGLQRLTAIKRFMVDNKLKLTGLEFLTDYEGRIFDSPDPLKGLERNLQRRIEETDVMLCLIEEGTPEAVKFNIFKRINTGSLPLSAQEIRHALNLGKGYKKGTDFLKKLAACEEFKKATDKSIKDRRMADKEFVLRFLAFTLIDYKNYGSEIEANFDSLLNETMNRINKKTDAELESLEKNFKTAMDTAYFIFDEMAFRKQYKNDERRYPINKALFETVAVNLGKLTDIERKILIQNKDKVVNNVINLLKDLDFNNAISQGTHDTRKVVTRFSKVAILFEQVIKNA